MYQDSVPTWFKREFPGEDFSSSDLRGLSYGQGVLDSNRDILREHGIDDDKIISNLCYAGAMVLARLNRAEVEELRADPRVDSVEGDVIYELHTDTSPGFLGLREAASPWARDVLGEDVIIGILDSGIHPEHPSFADTMVDIDLAGEPSSNTRPYPAPPARWNGDGTCEFGNQDYNADDEPFECNNKLLGARDYLDNISADRIAASAFLSARDSTDHGTHVASTAAGNFGIRAEIDGEFKGTITGIAPRARLSIYKVCWSTPKETNGRKTRFGGCSFQNTIRAIDQAIADGVDVINYSVGSRSTTFGASTVAWLSAANAGIWAVTSQGNRGPRTTTVGTPSGVPWITSVGALQDSGVFTSVVEVSAPDTIAGSYEGLEGRGPVTLEDTGSIEGEVVAVEPIKGCAPLSNDLTDKIALIKRGSCTFKEKYDNAAEAGARAIIVYNDGVGPNRILPRVMPADDTSIPGIMISSVDGATLLAELNDGIAVRVDLGPDQVISAQNRVAAFSSRGPNEGAPDIIKPDIAAPGFQILAASSPFTTPVDNDGELFKVLSGTSMSSPHVAGIFALLRQSYPSWSPAMARSALMTTARQNGLLSDGSGPATPFDVGSGVVAPSRAFQPGLVYDAGMQDYQAFSCDNNAVIDESRCDALRDEGFPTDGSQLNYPSIAVENMVYRETVRRTVTSVMDSESTFVVEASAPNGVTMEVNPPTLTLAPGEQASYEVTFTATPDAVLNEWAFGSLTWRSGDIRVRSPVAILPVYVDGLEEGIVRTEAFTAGGIDLQFGYDGVFRSRLHGFVPPELHEGTVQDDPENSFIFPDGDGVKTFRFDFPDETVYARFALRDALTEAVDDDLDMYVYLCAPSPDEVCDVIEEVGKSDEFLTSQETVSIELPKPASSGMFYIVAVHGVETEGPDTDFTLWSWTLGANDDPGNAELEVDQDPVRVGDTRRAIIRLPDRNLFDQEDARYLGAISYANEVGIYRFTVITATTPSRDEQN